MSDDPVDVDRLIDEIDDEVRRRRADGALDPAWERELDELFRAGAPPGVVADFPRLLDEAQRAALIDATPPADSNRPGGEAVKRMLGRTMSWYVAGIARQVTTLGTDLVEAVRVLGDRVARLEAVPGAAPGDGATLSEPHIDLDAWSAAVVGALGSTTGRVVHGDAGDGAMVRALLHAGVGAYGVEPRPALAERATARDVDVREEAVGHHLGSLAPESLGGLVLSGCIDTMPNANRRGLVRSARRAVVAGGRCVVIAWDPQHWGDDSTRVVADLAPGRPWHVETWSQIFADAGFATRAVEPGPQPGARMIVAERRA